MLWQNTTGIRPWVNASRGVPTTSSRSETRESLHGCEAFLEEQHQRFANLQEVREHHGCNAVVLYHLPRSLHPRPPRGSTHACFINPAKPPDRYTSSLLIKLDAEAHTRLETLRTAVG
jgi:hypothetical protein